MSGTALTRLDDALALVSADRLVDLTRQLVDVASPTGGEATLARTIGEVMASAGIQSEVQELDESSANVWGSIGPGVGNKLLLYAPLDTVTAGNTDEDVPWAAPTLRPDMTPSSSLEHGWIVGLGAQNPKGHAACILAAIEALAAAGISLDGRVTAGFGALGMPTNRRFPKLLDAHGAGCAALVAAVNPDAAVIAKSGWAVSWTEVGLAWFTVTVHGTHTYVGSRHLINYRNAIVDAAHIIAALEPWFEVWSQEQDDGMNSPQGIIGSVNGGSARATAFTPDICSFTVDLRLVPGLSGEEAEALFIDAVSSIASEHGATVDVERTVTVRGTRTDPDQPIIGAAIAAWEAETGRSHEPIRGLSGATDANILRAAGVPTARVGLPKVSSPGVDVDFQYGMNAVDPTHQVALTRQLIRTAVTYLEEHRE